MTGNLLASLGRAASSVIISIIVLVLGLASQARADGPSFDPVADLPCYSWADLAPPDVVVFLAPYRGQGPPSDAFAFDLRLTSAGSPRLLALELPRDGAALLQTRMILFLYCGEEWDANLNMYNQRARWMEPGRGRFWSMDTYGGNNEDPVTLHKYLYCGGNPVDRQDPNGQDFDLGSLMAAMSLNAAIGAGVSAPFQAIQLAQNLSAGISLGNALEIAALNVLRDAAISAALGGLGNAATQLMTIAKVGGVVARAASSAWNLAPFARGRSIEQTILGRLPTLFHIPNFPVIDDFLDGVATSIKSIDLTAGTYQSISALTSRLSSYATSLSAFTGAVRKDITIEAGDIADRVLLVAIEEGAATAEQAEALEQFVLTARSRWPNIKVMFEETQ